MSLNLLIHDYCGLVLSFRSQSGVTREPLRGLVLQKQA